jgi:hypothetical protein
MNEFSAYLSALKSNLLDRSTLDQIKKSKIEDIYDILKRTPYGKHFSYRDTLKISLEVAIDKRFREILEKISKRQDIKELILEYEIENAIHNLDQKIRNVEKPHLISYFDNKEKLMRLYKNSTVQGFLMGMKIYRYTKASDILELDKFYLFWKRKLANMFPNIRRALLFEYNIRNYLIQRLNGNPPNIDVPKEIKEEELYKAEIVADNLIVNKYLSLYSYTWETVEKAYIVIKAYYIEKRFLLGVINESPGYRN